MCVPLSVCHFQDKPRLCLRWNVLMCFSHTLPTLIPKYYHSQTGGHTSSGEPVEVCGCGWWHERVIIRLEIAVWFLMSNYWNRYFKNLIYPRTLFYNILILFSNFWLEIQTLLSWSKIYLAIPCFVLFSLVCYVLPLTIFEWLYSPGRF